MIRDPRLTLLLLSLLPAVDADAVIVGASRLEGRVTWGLRVLQVLLPSHLRGPVIVPEVYRID